ncbi:DUF4179 domain-containing protein [Psychrobacillus sp. FSL K6-2843]|uniref:DUF4179 domain-containing protein n=1 Tax=Psychrobacillus sp. FSL K6-2843 TaxID=2921549 RepID=UPI00315A462F
MSNKINDELNKIKIPKELHERSKRGVRKAKLENQKRRIKNPVIAVAMVGVLMFGASSISPAFASTLQSIPIIGSIFGTVGDIGLKEADKSGLSQITNETFSVGESSFMIREAIYDGSRLSLGFIITNYSNELPFKKAAYKIDEMNFYGGASSQGEFINDKDYAGIISFIVPNELKRDSFNFSISFDEFNGKKGNWNLNIPVTKIEGESFLVMDEATSKDYKIKMKKVTFTSATTEINFDLTEPINAEELNQIIRFRLYDDQGNVVKELSAGGGGCSDCENIDGKITLDTSVQYEPLKHIPDYLIIEPYISSTSENIAELRMEIPLKESE